MEGKVDLIELEGLRYRAIKTTTLQNDYYVMKHLHASGIANITPNQNEGAEDYAMRLMGAIIQNGIPLQLLGGLIIREEIQDKDWTPEEAETTSLLLSKLTAPQDKAKVQALIIAVVTDFFREGLRYLKPSGTVSAPEAVEGNQAQPGQQSAGQPS